MPLLSLVLVLLSALLEFIAGYLLFGSHHGPSWMWLWPALHALSAAGFAVASQLLRPSRYQARWMWSLLFFFSVAFFAPVLGALGLLLSVLPGLHLFHEEREPDWEERQAPDLPYKPVESDPDSVFMRVGIPTVIKHFSDQDWRRRAVMATRHLSGNRSVPILRNALGDKADEVRLLAYSMLSSKERVFEVELQALQQRLRDADTQHRDWIQEQIASLYWAQASLGLVEGELRAFLVRQALSYVEAAIAVKSTPSRLILRATLALDLERFDEADLSLAEAQALGVDGMQLAALRAELSYRRKSLAEVPQELRKIGSQMRALPRFAPLVKYWL